MNRKPRFLYNAAQVRELDRIAIEEHGIDGYALMCRAGESAWRLLQERWPGAARMNVLCGSGNNGGDGYVLARLALESGVKVRLIALGAAKSETAKQACRDFADAGGEIEPFRADRLGAVDLQVDAMLGTGLTQNLSGLYAQAVDAVNGAGRPVLALDVPTGVNADSGRVMGRAVEARTTVTFIGAKIGLFTGAGPDCAGEVVLDDLDVPERVFEKIVPTARIIRPELDSIRLPKRAPTAHKGQTGRVLIVGGGPGMPGAMRMAAMAAARCGAGLVQVATHPDHAGGAVPARPEVMVMGAAGPDELEQQLDKADVVAIGPGLGMTPWARSLFDRVLEWERPLVVDADALNLLAEARGRRDDWVLTPHPGEAGRLLGVTAADVQADRVAAVRDLKNRYGGVIVLKGAGSLVNDGSIWLCDRGNPGMASGGMGDVLTGVISALAVQGQPLGTAARFGVWLHAAAADRAADEGGQIGLLATDLLPHLRNIINE